MKTVLSIAGSDSIGGAGIQADLKTCAAHGVYGMTVVTAVTAQNTRGVCGIQEMPCGIVADQLDAVLSDIKPDAVKIGMLFSAGIIEAVADKLSVLKSGPVVLDPVMVASSGGRLLLPEAAHLLETKLMPLADLITPNLHEAAALWGKSIGTTQEMKAASEALCARYGASVLIKGGHLNGESNDLLCYLGRFIWFKGPRIAAPGSRVAVGMEAGVHGTGCTLSSAIACRLAEGKDLETSIRLAKAYVTGALKTAVSLGEGSASLDYGWNRRFIENG